MHPSLYACPLNSVGGECCALLVLLKTCMEEERSLLVACILPLKAASIMVGKCLRGNSRAKLWESQILLWRSCRTWIFCRGLEWNPGFIYDSKNLSVILSGQIWSGYVQRPQISSPYFQSVSGYQRLWRRVCCLFGGQSRTLHSWMTCTR